MSFTPQLFANDDGALLPLALDDELFILERAKISFQCKRHEHVFKGKGRVYCTTQRVIFVADKAVAQNGLLFEAFEMPLAKMTEEKFNQPIFGACSISGLVASDDAAMGWKLTFSNGGTGVVLPVFLRLLDKRKKKETIDQSFVQSQKKAFVDPNDPTIIYIAQPVKPLPPLASA